MSTTKENLSQVVDTTLESEPKTLTIRCPDDMHVHLRDGDMLSAVAPFTAAQFQRAIIMPNLKPPVRTLPEAQQYSERIKAALQPGTKFTPLMTLYLTDSTTPDDIRTAYSSGLVRACKLYPAGATTNSALGVTSIEAIAPALTAMQEVGMILCIHGEVVFPEVDIFDREAEFVAKVLPKVLNSYPTLKIVLEHITTAEAAQAILSQPPGRLAATVTAHHLLYSRHALFEGAKLHPHMFCLPVLKRDNHRQALIEAISEDEQGRFFAGTDSAPHPRDMKLCTDSCAGIFSAPCAVQLYTEAFDNAGLLHKLEAFLSENGASFYGLPLNEGTITLVKRPSIIRDKVFVQDSEPVIPLRAGQSVAWTIS